MRSYSINSSVRVVGASQAEFAVGSSIHNDKTQWGSAFNNGLCFDRRIQSEYGAKRYVKLADVASGLTMLVGFFTSCFNKLTRPLPEECVKKVVDISPQPERPPSELPLLEPTSPPSDTARYIPGLSTKRNGAKPDNIWRGFRQGPGWNCATVSAIKAAMHQFGQSPVDIYKRVTKVDGGYRVIMRDDFALTLTERELAVGARSTQFIGADKEMLKDAHFLFAVSAKRAQMENNDRTAGKSFHAAVRSLNDGEDEWEPGEGLQRLGLRKYMKTVAVSELARGQLGMCNRKGHSVAVINGREEIWGRQGFSPARGDAIALMRSPVS